MEECYHLFVVHKLNVQGPVRCRSRRPALLLSDTVGVKLPGAEPESAEQLLVIEKQQAAPGFAVDLQLDHDLEFPIARDEQQL